MRSTLPRSRLIASGVLAALAGPGHYALAGPADNRLCIEETAPVGAPLSGGYADLYVSDQRLGSAQVYGRACFKNPALGNREECFAVDGAMVVDPAWSNQVQISLAASALASVPAAATYLGFAQQSLTLDASTLTGTYRNLGSLVQAGIPTESYFEGTAKGIACPKRPVEDEKRERRMSNFIRKMGRL